MHATIGINGCLTIAGESELETFALTHWLEKYLTGGDASLALAVSHREGSATVTKYTILPSQKAAR